MLTGESLPAEAGAGANTFAGGLVRRGEAVGHVTATGARTKFGRTAELVRSAKVESSQQKTIMAVVRNLVLFNGGITLLLTGYARWLGLPRAQIIPLVLVAVLSSIPVALPAMFTLAAAVGARALARQNVWPTSLSAVDVLCADKTGTLTRNELAVMRIQATKGVEHRLVVEQASKGRMFFFEKRRRPPYWNQKTFMSLARDSIQKSFASFLQKRSAFLPSSRR